MTPVARSLAALIALLAGATLAHLVVGDLPLSPLQVMYAVLGQAETAQVDFVVNVLRVPRALTGALVGAALGVTGAILQAITRNPLASPDLTGVSGGAGLAAVVLIVAFPDAPGWLLPPAATAGGLSAALLLAVLTWRQRTAPMRLILIGIGIGATCAAATNALITLGEITQVQRAMGWLAGSLYARGWADVQAVVGWIGCGLVAAWLAARDLDALALGDELAAGLGLRVPQTRALLLGLAVLLAAAATAAAGTLAFIGLFAPHLARRYSGPRHAALLPLTAASGALIVVAADLLARRLLAPAELPVGVMVALLGAPYFALLLRRSARH
jgi:iron complex transport system permease protein